MCLVHHQRLILPKQQRAFFQPMGCVGQQIVVVADLNVRPSAECLLLMVVAVRLCAASGATWAGLSRFSKPVERHLDLGIRHFPMHILEGALKECMDKDAVQKMIEEVQA